MSSKTPNSGIITFEWIHNKRNVGSTRIRVKWPLKYWKEAEEWKVGRKYDVLIFQKAYMTEYAEMFDGIKILDLCDPDWLDGQPIMKMINRCDAVTCSSKELTETISKWTDKPVIYIPDRVDLQYCKQRKIHKGKAKSVVWFGYSHNSHALKHVIPYLKKLDLELICISESSIGFDPKQEYECKNVKFNTKTFNDEIIKGDIVLFPPSFKYRDKYKSTNKTIHSWSLGMPVAKTFEELQRFMSEEERLKESEKRLKEVKENYDVKQSVKQYKDLIKEVQCTKNSKKTE